MGSAFKYKLVIVGLIVVFLALMIFVWKPWEGALPGVSSSWRWPSFTVSQDTVFVTGPVQYIDKWHERIQYITQDPDTVQVVVYEIRPPTLDFVSGTITDDGEAFIEILSDSAVSHVIHGYLSPSGDTHFHPGPDSQMVFVSPRVGADLALAAGVGIHGPQVTIETLYWNDLPLLKTTGHLCADIAVDYDYIRGEEELEDALAVGLSMDVEISPFKTTGRFGLGALYDTEIEKVKFNAYLVFELLNP